MEMEDSNPNDNDSADADESQTAPVVAAAYLQVGRIHPRMQTRTKNLYKESVPVVALQRRKAMSTKSSASLISATDQRKRSTPVEFVFCIHCDESLQAYMAKNPNQLVGVKATSAAASATRSCPPTTAVVQCNTAVAASTSPLTTASSRVLVQVQTSMKRATAISLFGMHKRTTVKKMVRKNKQHVEGVTVKVGRNVFPFECANPRSDHDGCRVARNWEKILNDLPYGWTYFCSDDAGQCGRARRILALRHPDRFIRFCWSHRSKLTVKVILNTSTFKETATKAHRAVKALNASSSKWLPKLQAIVFEMYCKMKQMGISLMGICETRWNSSQACFASLLRIEQHCACLFADMVTKLDSQRCCWS
eukprot:IDg3485t1